MMHPGRLHWTQAAIIEPRQLAIKHLIQRQFFRLLLLLRKI